MAHYGAGNQSGHPGGQTDEVGNPIRQTDEYGRPVHHTAGGTMGDYGTTGAGAAYGTGVAGGHQQQQLHSPGQGQTGVLHRSGSSSSSSSEDDGHGGRRKKGLKEKIKEKLPGTGQKEQSHTFTATPGGAGYGHSYTGDENHEKKGVMEKIKEKLPGGHGHHP